ncbi:PIN domain-containing protein [Xanthomonas sacchari]|uniref:PIN domain-containing protein n=1 Tax=Xanthomonas sacchari TaxID=56458 RepID=UPI00224EF991|nr:PIN domain-containing protein [Xanthomonas sacchari]
MVVVDTATLLFILQPDANAPLGDSGKPIPKCRERVELLLNNLSEAGIRVVVPTPVLAELMVSVGPGKLKLLGEITHSAAFSVASFDQIAAVECSCLKDPTMNKKLGPKETKAKVKFDRQILAIAKVAGAHTLYTDDKTLIARATANGLRTVRMQDLPLPPEPPQGELALPPPSVEVVAHVEVPPVP